MYMYNEYLLAKVIIRYNPLTSIVIGLIALSQGPEIELVCGFVGTTFGLYYCFVRFLAQFLDRTRLGSSAWAETGSYDSLPGLSWYCFQLYQLRLRAGEV